ncbi:Forkhead box protein K2 [Seiridium cupressi]
MTSSIEAAAESNAHGSNALAPPATAIGFANSMPPEAEPEAKADADSHTDTNANLPPATPTESTREPNHADSQTTQQEPPQQSQLHTTTTTTTGQQDLDLASFAPHEPDQYMPSPPTVSPLSTPAVTAIHSTNGDHALDDDLPKLSDEQITAATLSIMNQNLLAQSTLPDLGQPFVPQPTQSQGYAAVATTDDDIDYSPHPLNTGRISRSNTMTDIDPAAFMIALAAGANVPMASDYPTAIAPSEISLAASQAQDDGTFESASASASQKLESFARIEFADSVFQMTTYAVIIGRDQRAMDQARKDEKRAARYKEACEKAEEQGLPPPTPMGRDRGKFSKSYVSEEGGILGPESDGGDSNPPRKKAPSQHDDPEIKDEQDDNAKSNLQYVSHSEGAAAVDLSSMQPSASHVPFVGIHSPGPNIAARTKGISRQHLKIQFNEKRGVFEGIALHKNGFFCDDVHYGSDEPVTVRSGSRLQIKDVEFFFVINGVETGKTGAEDLHDAEEASSKRCSVGGKEMSLEFEHSDQEQKKKFLRNTDSPSPLQIVRTPPPVSDDGDEDLGEDDDEGEEAAALEDQSEFLGDDQGLPYMDAATAAALLQSVEGGGELPPDFVLPRRRGPGRPPKDGIMSKRERRLLKKHLEAQRLSKKTLPQEPQGEKIKRPVGRPRKNPLPDDGDRPEKRKYTKRKREDGEEGSDAERRMREKKDKKVRPKSPPLDLKIEDYTHEQLKKPAKNYVHLIDEALQAGPEEGLSLKQIYKRITAAYPWYYFSAETKGWESSVRHNLIGNDGFKKNEETGLWQRVHGIDLDAGKKRKPPTPERQMGSLHQMGQQTYYHHPNYMQQGTLQFAEGLSGNTMSTNQQHQNYVQPASGQPLQNYAGSQAQANGQVAHTPQVQGQSASRLSGTPGSSVLPRQVAPQGAYSSPYPGSGSTTNAQFRTANIAPSPHGQQPALPQQVVPTPRPQANDTTASSAGARGGLGNPDENQKVVAFKAQMMKMLLSLGISHSKIQQLVETAINKAFGLPALPTLAGYQKVESRLTNEVLKILDKEPIQPSESPAPTPAPVPAPASVSASAPAPAPALATASTPRPAPPPKQQTPAPQPSPATMSPAELEIESSLAIFRDNFMKTFRSKCAQADFIMESAVNQAKGLPNAGKVKGWEQVNDLLVTEVTKIINNVRKKFNSQADTAASPAQPSQASPSPALRHAPSASPAPGQANTSSGAIATSSTLPNASSAPTIAKPAISTMRPSIMRPGAVSVARPSVIRQNSASTHPSSAQTPAPVPAQTQAPGSTPAPAFAQAPTSAQGSTTSQTVAPSPALQAVPVSRAPSVSDPASTAPTTSTSTGATYEAPPMKTISPLPQAVTQPPLAKMTSPAPPPTTKPSAGVMEQIMGQGQKRSYESIHGPGTDSTQQQPEPKKLATSAP